MTLAGPLARVANEQRIHALDQIAQRLLDAPPSTDHEFRDAVQALILCGVQASTIAGALDIAVSSISRWSQGSTVPRTTLRQPLASLLPRLAIDQANAYRALDLQLAEAA